MESTLPETGKESVRRVRGPTKLKTFGVRYGGVGKKHVEFDDLMRPTGKGREQFSTFLGQKARSKVGINWPTWKAVPQGTKEMLWEDILVCIS